LSQRRDELLDIRKQFYPRVEHMRKLGDYGAGAVDIRDTAEALLRVIDLLLERMR
jgi:hypothetical protein